MITKNKPRLIQKINLERFSKSFWVEIIVAFVLTRIILLAVGSFAEYFPANPDRPIDSIARGYDASSIRLIDIWVRSDSFHYLGIMYNDYLKVDRLSDAQSNWAFSPLYPYLLKPILFFVWNLTKNFDLVLATGVIISNLFLIIAMIFLYKFINYETQNKELARQSIWLLLVFPTSFFLSSLYTESLFLLLSVGCLYAIRLHKWSIASLIASLLAITKPMGVVIWIMLGTSYNWKQLRWKEISWFVIVPLCFSAFIFKAYFVTGDVFAPFNAHQDWGKHLDWAWSTILAKSYQLPVYLYFERILAIVFIFLIPVMIKRLPKTLSIYGVLLMLPILHSGNIMTFGRHLVLNFPFIITIALLAKKPKHQLALSAFFMLLQSIIMVGWAQSYNIW